MKKCIKLIINQEFISSKGVT